MAKSSSTYRRAGLLLALKGNRYALREEYGIAAAYYHAASTAFVLGGRIDLAVGLSATADRYEAAEWQLQQEASAQVAAERHAERALSSEWGT